MKKVTLAFPSYDSLWTFRDQTKAINIRIEPKKYLMSGLFDENEVDLAIGKFHAVQDRPESSTNNPLASPSQLTTYNQKPNRKKTAWMNFSIHWQAIPLRKRKHTK